MKCRSSVVSLLLDSDALWEIFPALMGWWWRPCPKAAPIQSWGAGEGVSPETSLWQAWNHRQASTIFLSSRLAGAQLCFRDGHVLLVRHRTCPVSATWKNTQAVMGWRVPICQLTCPERCLGLPLLHSPQYLLFWAVGVKVCSLCSTPSVGQPLKHF